MENQGPGTVENRGCLVMIECNCLGCKTNRYGYAPVRCVKSYTERPTTSVIGKDDPRIGGGSDAVYLIPLVIFCFSVGMAVGKFWL